jgi:hypothetical protein
VYRNHGKGRSQNSSSRIPLGACYNFLNEWQDPDEELAKGFPNCCIFKYEYEDKKFKLIEVIRPDFTNLQ